jgi:hypothetical protein
MPPQYHSLYDIPDPLRQTAEIFKCHLGGWPDAPGAQLAFFS